MDTCHLVFTALVFNVRRLTLSAINRPRVFTSTKESVYTGLSTDWTHGHVQGLTLTVLNSHSGILNAFLAIFVSIAGGHCWDIFCYIIFHMRSTVDTQDGLYHQQQALLRNDLSDNQATWQVSAIAWEWRGKAKRRRVSST